MTTAASSPSLSGAHALARLHLPRDIAELRAAIAEELDRVVPGVELALFVHEDEQRSTTAFARNSERYQADASVWRSSWEGEGALLPLRYAEQTIGDCWLASDIEAAQRNALQESLEHVTIALVNQRLREESRRAADDYCAGLQALQEGVVLFQEQDPEAVGARFLDLTTKVLGAAAGAVCILEEIGNPNSKLELHHCWGMPEQILDHLVLDNGQSWLDALVQGQLTYVERSDDGFGPFPEDSLPPALFSLLGTPLGYHGVRVGVCVFFNVPSLDNSSRKRESCQRMLELGAAVFHRFDLERRSIESKLLDGQLEIASRLQAGLIPDEAPASERFRFSWCSRPAQFIGGDLVDLVDDGGMISATIADVSGHGINSALLMTSFRASCRAGSQHQTPDELLGRLNDTVKDEVGDTGMFLTAVTMRCHEEDGAIEIASAGHNDSYVYRKDSGEIETIESSGPPLGFFRGCEYEQSRINGQPGDLVILYTDGVVESTSPDDGEMFEDERLFEVIRKTAPDGADAVRDAILDAVATFTRSRPQEDDISILVIEFV